MSNENIANFMESDDELLGLYFSDINKIPMLTYEEEYELAMKAKKGDRAAFDRIINANLRFVVSVAKKYQGQGLPLSDLIDEGNIGLITALEKFEPEKGYHFISYAVWWIRQSIMKAISEKARPVRLPLNRSNELVQILKAQRTLMHSKETDTPDTADIAEETGLDETLVKDLLQISQEMVNLDATIKGKDDSESSMTDFLEDPNQTPEDEVVESSLSEEITDLLAVLTEKEQEIIRLRYGLTGKKPMSLKEIGVVFGLTKERIRQIEKRSLEKLREAAMERQLDSYTIAC